MLEQYLIFSSFNISLTPPPPAISNHGLETTVYKPLDLFFLFVGGDFGLQRCHPNNIWKGGKDPHPQDFSLTKKTARFTEGQFRPY